MRAAPAETCNANLEIICLECRFLGAEFADEVDYAGMGDTSSVLECERDGVEYDLKSKNWLDEKSV